MSASDKDLVSVVIPNFNGEAFVTDAVNSALFQSHDQIEVIVVDDGSSDASLNVLARFGEAISVISGPNHGACAARNQGLRLAKGKWVQFLDADDLLHCRKVERQLAHAKRLPERVLSVCLGESNLGSGFLHSQYQRLLNPGRDPVDFLISGVLQTSAPLHRRIDLLAVGGFDESLPCAQEYDLHLRLACSGVRLSQLRETLFTVRHREGSVSSNSAEVLRQKRTILNRARTLLLEQGELTSSRVLALAVELARSGQWLERLGDLGSAEKLLRDAVDLHPDAIALSWTKRWRPLVRVFGHRRTSWLKQAVREMMVRVDQGS